ncbi:sigma-70 family RNA polymerase sigma factor, partial [Acaryochloris marina NIES-2412]
PSADQRCRGLGESGTSGGGHLGFGQAVTRFIHRPLATISDCLRGIPSRAGPDDSSQQPQRGAVFDSNPPPPQTNLPRKNAMYKTIAA